MKNKMSMCLLGVGVALVMIMPGGCVATGTPSSEGGSMTQDPYWEANPGWCCVMTQNDVDVGNWGTGVDFYEVSYSTGPPDDFNKYILEMTIPWIGIKMTGENMVRYDHSNTSSDDHLCLNSYTIHNYSQLEQYTSLDAYYDLDFDGDSNIEWSFWERIEFQPPAGGATGFFKIEIQITTYPTLQNGQWGHDGNTVQTIDIPYFVDPDVYDSSANDFYSGSAGNWVHVTEETSVQLGANDGAQITNDAGNPVHKVTLWPIPQGVNPATKTMTFLQYMGNEYAKDPVNYDENAGLEDTNGLVWYVESYNVQQQNPNGEPPNANDGTMSGIKGEDLTA